MEAVFNPIFLAMGTAVGGVIASNIGALSYRDNFRYRIEYLERLVLLLEKLRNANQENKPNQTQIDTLIQSINLSIIQTVEKDLNEMISDHHNKISEWPFIFLFRKRVRSRLILVLQFIYFLCLSFIIYVLSFRLSGNGFLSGDLLAIAVSSGIIVAILIFSNWYQGPFGMRSKSSFEISKETHN